MRFSLNLEYTPRCPQPGLPFTEESMLRKSRKIMLETNEIGIALVDLWNFGWEDGPIGATLGSEQSFEWGESHARRKRDIIEHRIVPTVDELRKQGAWRTKVTVEDIEAKWGYSVVSKDLVSAVRNALR